PLHERQALGGLRDVETAALLPAGGKTGLALQIRVELDAVAAHARGVARRPRLADEAGCMPCRAAGEAALLEQHHLAHAELREVIGGRHAGYAAADDHDARVARWRAHALIASSAARTCCLRYPPRAR